MSLHHSPIFYLYHLPIYLFSSTVLNWNDQSTISNIKPTPAVNPLAVDYEKAAVIDAKALENVLFEMVFSIQIYLPAVCELMLQQRCLAKTSSRHL